MDSSNAQESTQPRQSITTIALAVLALVFLALRLVARRMKRVDLGADDWTLVVGLFFVFIIAGLNLACIHYGMGTHTGTIPLNDQSMIFKLIYAFEPLYIVTASIVKLAVLLMYYRIFPVRFIKIGGLILGGTTLAWMIGMVFLALFQCWPIAKAYNPMLPGHCIVLKDALIGNGVPNFVLDICILALPTKLIWGLQASLWQRISIICVFLTGSFVVFASIYRFSLIFIFDITDVPWSIADAQTWCVVESAAGVISACLPTLAPIIKFFTKGLVSTARSLSKSNLTQSGTGALSQVDAGEAGLIHGDNKVTITAGNAPRHSNGNYAMTDMSPNNRGSSHLKGKGWTMISTETDREST
ncbi:uncharacterized protein N7479_006647 [Penicillium vulpinum]|uniref:Rhodopsin domain-containing protein n=1 Tax=Penicillium vulpinum TaxID=29845 RepID=A0A1V6S3C8_9EURO|nr:uncharacterized protein N7479_006647 [Penicillium vulpinum]KAJ5959497.1 hypothetical protein N7479_006647 [Penicillium vulpinum]OQE08143.1 hypothetical protein PENVUL_c011G06648 [Penicillium vulpinum]